MNITELTELTPDEMIRLHYTNRAVFMMVVRNREQAQHIKNRLSDEAWQALVSESCNAVRRKYPWLYRKVNP